jgi:hypothetical protein
MKVRVAFTIDVDAAAWCDAYGIDRAEVRADVIEYVRSNVVSGLVEMGLAK